MPQRRSSASLETPCVGVCAIEPASGLCRGCGRTLEEIAAWAGLSGDMRRAIMADLPARRARLEAAPPDAAAPRPDETDALR